MKKKLILLFLIGSIIFVSVIIAITINLRDSNQIQTKIVEEPQDYVTALREKDELESIEQLKSQLKSKAEKVESFKADYLMKKVSEDYIGSVEIEKGKVFYKKGKGFRLIIDIPQVEYEAGDRNLKLDKLITENKIISVDLLSNIAYKIRLDKVRGKILENNVHPKDRIIFDIWESKNFLKPFKYAMILGYEIVDWYVDKIEGVSVYKFVMSNTGQTRWGKDVESTATLWVDEKHGVLRKLIVKDEDDIGFFLELKKIVINIDADIKDSLFHLSIDEDVAVIDETYEILYEIEQLKLKKIHSIPLLKFPAE